MRKKVVFRTITSYSVTLPFQRVSVHDTQLAQCHFYAGDFISLSL